MDKHTADKHKGPSGDHEKTFFTRAGTLFKVGMGRPTKVSNFYLTIKAQKVVKDGAVIKDRILDLAVHMPSKAQPIRISVSERDFLSDRLKDRVLAVAGAEAILYGSAKDLSCAAQELSETPIPEQEVHRSAGFQLDGTYLSKGVLINPKRIARPVNKEIDLSECASARHLGFRLAAKGYVARAANHILKRFLALKQPKVMYPLVGHIVLAAFSSQIHEVTGKTKSVMHLQGPSGAERPFWRRSPCGSLPPTTALPPGNRPRMPLKLKGSLIRIACT